MTYGAMMRIETKIAHALGKVSTTDWIRVPVIIFVITRLVVFVSGYISLHAFPLSRHRGIWRRLTDNLFLDGWVRWDSGYYLEIFEKGYSYRPGEQCSAAFFPLYPLVAKVFTPFTDRAEIALLLTSLIAFLAALILLYKLVKLEFNSPAIAERATFYFAIFPTAFFFNAAYSESLFAFLAIGTFYFARKRRWLLAGVFGMLGSATRVPGILLFGVLWLEWLRSHGWTPGKVFTANAWQSAFSGFKCDWTSLLFIHMAPLGLVAFMLYLNGEFNDPLTFVRAQSAWSREFVGPLQILSQALVEFFSQPFVDGIRINWILGVDLFSFFFVFITGIFIWRKLGASYGLFNILNVSIPVSTSIYSMSRMAVVCFPAFMCLAVVGEKKAWDRLIVFSSSTLLAILSARFVNWIWVA